jgi:hypothetical protein
MRKVWVLMMVIIMIMLMIMILMLTDPDSSEHQSTARDFQAFLRDHIDDLRMHPTTTFQLIMMITMLI